MAYFTGHNSQTLVRLEIAPTTGSTTAVNMPYNMIVLTNASTAAAQTIQLDPTPNDGHYVRLSNFSAITSLTFSPSVTGWTDGATLAAGTGLMVAWSAPQAVWYSVAG